MHFTNFVMIEIESLRAFVQEEIVLVKANVSGSSSASMDKQSFGRNVG